MIAGVVAEQLTKSFGPLEALSGLDLEVPAGTVEAMDSVTVWLLPAATLNGDAGEVVTPAGNPASVTVTDPVNPF